VIATMSRTGGVPSTRQTMVILRVRCLTRTVSLDLRSWLQHKMTSRLRSATMVTTW
jgi:hypothetical protein